MADYLSDKASVGAPHDPTKDPGVPAKKKRRSQKQLDEFLSLARERFAQAEEADAAQRERELEDIEFYNGSQWNEDVLASRRAQPAANGMPPVPARPCFVINKQREPVRQVLNQERQSDLGIELVAADDFGDLAAPIDDTELQLREGLIRRIQRDSHASDARTWAFARAVQAGRGYYLVMTRYLPGKTWDQEVYVQRLYNQASVSLDPAHEQPDGSDAEWGFVGRDMPWAEYKATYPRLVDTDGVSRKNDVARADSDEFRSYGDLYPGWFTADGETRSIRVVDYYYTERETRTLAILEDGSVHWSDETDETPVDTREVIEKKICWVQLDGLQILDETEWPGPDLPIVKVVGEELQPSDDERRYEGMVRPSRHSQQGYNAMVSKWVETVGLAPIPPFQVAEGQTEGYEAWYQAANTRTLPYLPYRTRDLEGTPVGPPIRTQVDTPIQAIAGSVQLFSEAIQSTTGLHDPSLGRVDPTLKSGKAIAAIQQQGQQSTSSYLDNLQRSIRYEAQIINNLLYPIYNRPGRMARILNGQGEPETVLLHQPSVMQQGKPAKAPLDPATGQPAPEAKTYTLTKDASFNVVVKIAKNFDTRRQQETDMIGQLLGADPALMGVFGDLFFKFQDGPGHTEMAERAKAMLVPPVQALLKSQKDGQGAPDPQTAALQQQLQQAQQMLQQLQQQLQTDQVKMQGQMQIAQMKAQADAQTTQADVQAKAQQSQADLQLKMQIAQLDADTKLKIAAMDNEARMRLEEWKLRGVQMQAEIDAREAEFARASGIEAKTVDQAHEVGMTQLSAEQQRAQADQQHQQALEQGEVGHAQSLEAQQMAAQQAPDGSV